MDVPAVNTNVRLELDVVRRVIVRNLRRPHAVCHVVTQCGRRVQSADDSVAWPLRAVRVLTDRRHRRESIHNVCKFMRKEADTAAEHISPPVGVYRYKHRCAATLDCSPRTQVPLLLAVSSLFLYCTIL